MIAYTTLAYAAVLDLTIYFCRPNVQFRVAQMDIWEKNCRPSVCRPNVVSPKWPYTVVCRLSVVCL